MIRHPFLIHDRKKMCKKFSEYYDLTKNYDLATPNNGRKKFSNTLVNINCEVHKDSYANFTIINEIGFFKLQI